MTTWRHSRSTQACSGVQRMHAAGPSAACVQNGHKTEAPNFTGKERKGKAQQQGHKMGAKDRPGDTEHTR
jgi:hypothetical protein